MELDIRHDPARQRFAATLDGLTNQVDYRISEGLMRITHTGVAEQLRGRGIAGALVQAALDHAREHGLKVEPLCSYAAAYMQRHPETDDLRVGAA